MIAEVTPPPPPISLLPAGQPQLAAEHLQQLQVARFTMRKIRRAVAMAWFDGVTIGVFGLLTLIFGLTDPTSLLLGGGMMAVAIVELTAASRLKRLDATAARTLAWNQVALGSMLLIYAIWQLFHIDTAATYAELTKTDPELRQMLEPVEGLTTLVMQCVYGALIVVAIFGQGGMALYYHFRRRSVESYTKQTPEWILTMQRAGVSV